MQKEIHQVTESGGDGHVVCQTTQRCASHSGAVVEGHTTVLPKAAKLALHLFLLEMQAGDTFPSCPVEC